MKIAFEPFCTALNYCNGTASIFYSSHITPLHSHNTLQLVFDLKGTFMLRTAEAAWKKYSGAIIRENIVHQLNTNESLQLIIYIDPISLAGQKLKAKYLQDCDIRDLDIVFSPLEEMLIHKNLIEPGNRSIKLLIDLIFDRIINYNDLTLNNERITDVLRLVKQTNPIELSIDQLAATVFISPSRLRMQFKQALGVSLHQHIIRHKILSAVNSIINGSSIQDAAYKSGFNDSSHLNKLMLKTFDINPSMFLKENKNFYVAGDNTLFELKTALALPG